MVQFSAPHYSVNQSAGSITITVTRSGDTSGTATVHYSTGGGTAKAGVDYVAADGDITFNAGETSKTITITINDSAHPPFQHSDFFLLALSGPGDQTVLGTPRTARVVIFNR
jgi:hypothetical protein